MDKPLLRDLDFQSFQANCESLMRNARKAWVMTVTHFKGVAAHKTNYLLVRLNGPVTFLNNWATGHCARIRGIHQKKKEEFVHRLEIERMENEGGPVRQPSAVPDITIMNSAVLGELAS